MELSIFLAKLFGLYMLTVAALGALRREALMKALEEFFANRALMFMSGLLALLVGFAVVIGHHVWEPNWRGVITFFGYASIAKGIVRIGFPDVPQKAVGALMEGPKFWIWFVIVAVVGGYLAWSGFTMG